MWQKWQACGQYIAGRTDKAAMRGQSAAVTCKWLNACRIIAGSSVLTGQQPPTSTVISSTAGMGAGRGRQTNQPAVVFVPGIGTRH